MSKMIIIEGNSNEKDNVRTYMVKGERGYSAYDLYVQNGGTLTEEEWLDEFLNAENFYNKSEIDTSQTNQNNVINKKPYYFNSVAEMKAYNLQAGDMVITNGYYSSNDGGDAKYLIVDNSNLIDNGGSVHELSNGLKATLIFNNQINVRQFGAKGDGSTNDTTCFNNAISYANANNINIFIPQGNYVISNDLNTINSGISIYGEVSGAGLNESKTRILDKRESNNYLLSFQLNSNYLGGCIKNIYFKNYTAKNCIEMSNFNGYIGFINECVFENYYTAIRLYKTNELRIQNCLIYECGGRSENSNEYGIDIQHCMGIMISKCVIEHSRYCLYIHEDGAVKVVDNSFELSTNYITKGNSPILCDNPGGTLFTGNSFVTIGIDAYKDIFNDNDYSNVPYMITTTSKSVCNFSNNTFLCGVGSANHVTDKDHQAKFLNCNMGSIVSNSFRDCSYLVASIILGENTEMTNNNLSVNLTSDNYNLLENKWIINNYFGNVKDNIFRIIQDDITELPYFLKLSQYYSDYKIVTNNTNYDYKNLYVDSLTQDNITTFVLQFDWTPYGLFHLKFKRNQADDCQYDGYIYIQANGTINEKMTLFKRLTNYSVKIGRDGNNIVIQIIGTPKSNFNIEIEDIKNMRCVVFRNKYKNTEISYTGTLTLSGLV